tara:strand:+ start:58 stop:465 length:408 start_codon:yes stop_codon:yes gene_type:complete
MVIFKMKKIYNKNAREKQLLEEAYGAIYERRNPDSGEWGGGLKGVFPGAEEGPEFDEEEEHDESKYDTIKRLIKELADEESVAAEVTLDDIRRFLSYGYGEDAEDNVNWDEKDEVDEVGGGMNAKEFASLRKTPL